MKITESLCVAITAVACCMTAAGQAPKARVPAARLQLMVTTPAWPDGGEVPLKYAVHGDNKSPAFEFHWTLGGNPVSAPDGLQSYAVILYNIEDVTNKTTADVIPWSAWNIPGMAQGLPEGLGQGDLADGTRNGPGTASKGGNTPAYFGPGSGPGAFHHYIFVFYALDTKLDLPANTTRDDLMKAMDGHLIGRTAWVGRYHYTSAP